MTRRLSRRSGAFWAGAVAGKFWLFGLDIGYPNDLFPSIRFAPEEFSEIGGRTGQDRAAQIGDARADLGIGQSHIDFLIEPVDDSPDA